MVVFLHEVQVFPCTVTDIASLWVTVHKFIWPYNTQLCKDDRQRIQPVEEPVDNNSFDCVAPAYSSIYSKGLCDLEAARQELHDPLY